MTGDGTVTPEAMLNYLDARGCEVDRERDELLAGLTERECALVREAAVMGFVQGTYYAGMSHRVEIPPDREILRRTLDGVLTFPELYRTLTGWTPDEQDGDPPAPGGGGS